MGHLDYRTAGESHGPALISLVEGLPTDLPVAADRVNAEMQRRQGGFGRSGRQRIESDSVDFLSGVRHGLTSGGPVVMLVRNRDSRLEEMPPIHAPRPGHADLAGSIKWLTSDCRNTVERASARETAARVAAGGLARCLLERFGIDVVGFTLRIGPHQANVESSMAFDGIRQARDANEVYCTDQDAASEMVEAIRRAGQDGDTLGGVVEVRVSGLCPGLGSCMRSQDKLDGRLMGALGSIQAIKGVEIGLGFEAARRRGSEVHDEIHFDPSRRQEPALGFVRGSNHAGGLEGGMTNGQMVVIRAAMKPISTLVQGMSSVDLRTRAPHRSAYERSDICAVPAAGVVAENVVAFEIARALLEKFGGDTLTETEAAYHHFLTAARQI